MKGTWVWIEWIGVANPLEKLVESLFCSSAEATAEAIDGFSATCRRVIVWFEP